MENSPSQKKGPLKKSRTIRLKMVNTRSRSFYYKEKSTIRKILNKFCPYLIKSYPWFHISNFVSQKILLTPITLEKLLKVLGVNDVKKIYLHNITITIMLTLFWLPC